MHDHLACVTARVAVLMLDIPPDRLRGALRRARRAAACRRRRATADALTAPLDYPPLAQLVVPGDKVCVALADGVPQAAAITRVVVDRLLAAGISAVDITVIRASTAAAAGCGGWSFGPSMPVAKCKCSPTIRPIASGSRLSGGVDRRKADLPRSRVGRCRLVIPIGCQRLDAALGYFGLDSGLFPTFSDAKNLGALSCSARGALRPCNFAACSKRRIRSVGCWGSFFRAGGSRRRRRRSGGAGRPDRAQSTRGPRAAARQAWKSSVASGAAHWSWRHSPGRPVEQTWLNVARAMAAALRVVEEGGAIVICSDLTEAAGPAVRWLAADRESRDAAARNRPRTARRCLGRGTVGRSDKPLVGSICSVAFARGGRGSWTNTDRRGRATPAIGRSTAKLHPVGQCPICDRHAPGEQRTPQTRRPRAPQSKSQAAVPLAERSNHVDRRS